MIYIPPRPPKINPTLPAPERARRQVWNARYTLRVVRGLPHTEFDQREARRLRIWATDLLRRRETTLAAVARPSAPVEVLPPVTPEISERELMEIALLRRPAPAANRIPVDYIKLPNPNLVPVPWATRLVGAGRHPRHRPQL